MPDWLNQLLMSAGGGAVVALALFRVFGERVVSNWFDVAAEKRKQEHQRALEELRHSISLSYSRITKIHEHEFDVLPRAFELMHESLGCAASVVNPVDYAPDFASLSEEQLHEVLKVEWLSDSDRRSIREADDQYAAYYEAKLTYQLREAIRSGVAFGNFVITRSIFMTDSLRDRFLEMRRLVAEAQRAFERSRELRDPELDAKARDSIRSCTEDLAPQIEKLIKERLEHARAEPLPRTDQPS